MKAQPEPILLVDLFPQLSRRLLKVLAGLDRAEWRQTTPCCHPWTVKDLVAHLIDGNLRRLSANRDGFTEASEAMDFPALVRMLNGLNAEWVQAARRLSPEILLELLEISDGWLYHYLKTLDPFAPALFSVAWAGEERSQNWFDIAREFTEKWHHQQHIREAVDQPGGKERKFLHPVLDTFMRALPFAYAGIDAPQGTFLVITVRGPAGGTWGLRREPGGWNLYPDATISADAAATVIIDEDTAWRLFTKGITPEAALERMTIAGDRDLGSQALSLVAIMA